MSDINGRFKKAPSRKKGLAVKHVEISAEAKKAYEDQMRERDEREKTYGRHLAATEKR